MMLLFDTGRYLRSLCVVKFTREQPYGSPSGGSRSKPENSIPYDPDPLLLGRLLQSEPDRDACTSMFTGALFTIAKLDNKPRCSPQASE